MPGAICDHRESKVLVNIGLAVDLTILIENM